MTLSLLPLTNCLVTVKIFQWTRSGRALKSWTKRQPWHSGMPINPRCNMNPLNGGPELISSHVAVLMDPSLSNVDGPMWQDGIHLSLVNVMGYATRSFSLTPSLDPSSQCRKRARGCKMSWTDTLQVGGRAASWTPWPSVVIDLCF